MNIIFKLLLCIDISYNMTYNYNIAVTFPTGLELGQLQKLIVQDPGITSTLTGLSSDNIDLTITFDSSLSAPELVILNSIISNYVFISQPTLNPNGSIVSYNLTNMTFVADTTYFKTIGRMCWIDSRYRRYTNATIIIIAFIYDRDLEWILYDSTGMVPLGSGTIVSSGLLEIGVNIPSMSTDITLQIRKTLAGGQNPELSSTALEFFN